MFEIFRTPKFDFMSLRYYGFALSGLILAASVAVLGWHWKTTGELMDYGIDFKGGTLMQVRFRDTPQIDQLRSSLDQAGFGNASIQRYGKPEENSMLLRLNEQLEANKDLVARIREALRPAAERDSQAKGLLDLNSVGEEDLAALMEKELTGTNEKSRDPRWNQAALAVIAARGATSEGMFKEVSELQGKPGLDAEMVGVLEKHTYAGSLAFLRTESVGPAVGKDLRSKALFASLIANGLILLYLSFRFEPRFGVAAVICIIHDVIFIIGVFAITRREFDLTVLAAILTVIGYSVNDTIVVFDRVRENLKLMKRSPLPEIINTSINQTLSRTILTSGATLIVIAALLIYGGPVLNGFAFALLVGILEGTYSSIFVAAPLVLVWEKWFGQAPAAAR